MILILRGHIRETFNNKRLYKLIKQIHQLFPELKIFVHTWNIVANNISWRNIKHNAQVVDEKMINEYFGDLQHLIRQIIIDDDTKIQLIGNLKGKINNGPMPVIGWKNYWYGKHKIIDFIYNSAHIDKNELVVNCRFDVLSNSNNFTETHIVDFLKKNIETKFTKNVFMFDQERCGIDNIYIGNADTMYKLSHTFVHQLDKILEKNKDTVNQEKLVYRVNSTIFQ